MLTTDACVLAPVVLTACCSYIHVGDYVYLCRADVGGSYAHAVAHVRYKLVDKVADGSEQYHYGEIEMTGADGTGGPDASILDGEDVMAEEMVGSYNPETKALVLERHDPNHHIPSLVIGRTATRRGAKIKFQNSMWEAGSVVVHEKHHHFSGGSSRKVDTGSAVTGTLRVTVKAGDFRKNLETFGKMDPFVGVSLEEARADREPAGKDGLLEALAAGVTKVVENGGKQPVFTEDHENTFELPLVDKPVSGDKAYTM